VAATLALPAMRDGILTAGKPYRDEYAARHLGACDALAHQIADFETYMALATFVTRLRCNHGRKTGVWGHLA